MKTWWRNRLIALVVSNWFIEIHASLEDSDTKDCLLEQLWAEKYVMGRKK